MTNNKCFGNKLYFVHDDELSIVEGCPLVKFNIDIPYQSERRYTKFGSFWGQYQQFGLFDVSGKFPELKVCVYWDCKNLFQQKWQAKERLKEILSEVAENYDYEIDDKRRQIQDLQEEMRGWELKAIKVRNKRDSLK